MSNQEQDFQVEELFASVFRPEKGAKVAVLADLPHGDIVDNKEWSDRRQMAQEWQRALAKASKRLNIQVLPLAFYAATGQANGPLPDIVRAEGRTYPIEKWFAKSDIVLALTEFSATAPLRAWAKAQGSLRGASMPGVSKRMEATALAADYQEVARRAQKLVTRLREASGATVIFSTGHELYMDLRYRMAEVDDGQCPPGADPPFINLPSGEAYQAPYEGERSDEPSKTEGVIPVDLDGELALFHVCQNRITELDGEGAKVAALREFFAVDDARRNIAELGLGCNPKAVVTGNVLEDEKAGFHLAYGRSEHLGGAIGPDAFSDPRHVVHQDIVYAADSPVGIQTLRLEFPEGSTEDIMRDSVYTIF